MLHTLVDGLLIVLIGVILLGYPGLLWWMNHACIWPLGEAIRADLARLKQRGQQALRERMGPTWH